MSDRQIPEGSRKSSPKNGILVRVTAADQGLIERPVLAPHLDFYPIEDNQTLLISESFNTLLHGPIYRELLPLLDGRGADELVAGLSDRYRSTDISTALAALSSRGYAISGDFSMDRSRAAYWTSLGASPRWAEQQLAQARVRVIGDDEGRFSSQLKALGFVLSENNLPTLSVVVCADYLDQSLEGINRQHIKSGSPWLPVQPKGLQTLFGPVFRPAEKGPCWACLAYRMRSHREVHNFLRNFAGNEAAFRPSAVEPVILNAVFGLVSAEIAKWLVLKESAVLHDKAISLDTGSLRSSHHAVMRRLQCQVCGDPALHRSDRHPVPVQLRSCPVRIGNSGGVRSVDPQQTLARYRHLIDPVCGVVTWLTRRSTQTEPWLHVYWAGSNLGLRSRKLSSLRRSLRSKSAGKGSTREQSEASALCEAIERYSGAFHGDEIRCRKRYADFTAAGDEVAIHPNEIQLFSERQLDNATAINARGHPYNIVPCRLDFQAEIDWSPVWSLTQQRHRYLPTSLLYGMTAEERGNNDMIADSNGCAAGNTLEEAILQGFLELVERDAFAIWWYNRLSVPAVDLASFGDDYLTAAPDYYSSYGREMWVLDVSADLEIPVFVAISRRTKGDTEDIIYSAGAHPNPRIAALRAVCELNQSLVWLPGTGSGPAIDDPLALWWWKTARLADHPYLAPADGMSMRGKEDYACHEATDLRDEVDRCRTLIEARGMEFLVLDQTRPDIGMPVVRVIVPGLRHFWERLAPGRLYDVPVELGRCNRMLNEEELNPVPVIA